MNLSSGTSRVVAIDVGGGFCRQMRGSLIGSDASILANKQVITPRAGSDELVATVTTLAKRLVDHSRSDGPAASAICVAVPGMVDESTGVVHRSPNLAWQETPLARILEERLQLPAFLVHDLRGAAAAEGLLGAGRGVPDYLLVSVGAGVGSAAVIAGRPLVGMHSAAGEIGHISVDPTGRTCGCGGRGCVETFASESALATRYIEASGQYADCDEVVKRAIAGEPAAAAIWGDAVDALAIVIASSVALLDCGLVILAGTMIGGQTMLTALRPRVEEKINFIKPPRLAIAALGDGAAIFGAAASAFDRSGKSAVTQGWRQATQRTPA